MIIHIVRFSSARPSEHIQDLFAARAQRYTAVPGLVQKYYLRYHDGQPAGCTCGTRRKRCKHSGPASCPAPSATSTRSPTLRSTSPTSPSRCGPNPRSPERTGRPHGRFRMTTAARSPEAIMTSPAATSISQPTLNDQLAHLMAQVAGYVGHRTIAIGLRTGLVPALADAPGASPDQLATSLGLDQLYTAVWCRAALATPWPPHCSTATQTATGWHRTRRRCWSTTPPRRSPAASSRCSSSPRTSAASKPASPAASAHGGTRPARPLPRH